MALLARRREASPHTAEASRRTNANLLGVPPEISACYPEPPSLDSFFQHGPDIGGGLAGVAAALRLLERGCRVSIFEASERLGGKAGAAKHGSDFDEHGCHIFPDWYYNARRIAAELRILDRFADCEDFFQLEPGAFPDLKNYKNITSWRYAWRNLRAGVLPFFEAFLFYYSALDLMSQPYSYRAQLDQVTVTGFLRSRFYRTDRVATQFQELMLKGISAPTYEVSAMTMRNVMRPHHP